jgi:hypothetical protein
MILILIKNWWSAEEKEVLPICLFGLPWLRLLTNNSQQRFPGKSTFGFAMEFLLVKLVRCGGNTKKGETKKSFQIKIFSNPSN